MGFQLPAQEPLKADGGWGAGWCPHLRSKHQAAMPKGGHLQGLRVTLGSPGPFTDNVRFDLHDLHIRPATLAVDVGCLLQLGII